MDMVLNIQENQKFENTEVILKMENIFLSIRIILIFRIRIKNKKNHYY